MRFLINFLLSFFIFQNLLIAQESSDAAKKEVEDPNNKIVSKNLSNKNKEPVKIPFFETSPIIDGSLDEEIWKQSADFGDFLQIQPGDNISPSFPTNVYIGYDQTNLYIAFKAFDKGKIRATVAKRDEIFDDDNVSIYLDTFNDQRRAYYLLFNPFGIQADAIFTEGAGSDFSVDIVMESKGMVIQDGYTIEVMIPFKSLRYEVGEGKSWGFHIFREIKRLNNEENSWMPISRDQVGLLNQAGAITGLTEIAKERTLEIIPSLLLSENGVRRPIIDLNDPTQTTRFVNLPIEVDPGLNIKAVFSPNLTLDVAINPDFATVEADDTVVTANQRFPIFFAEKRPFFLEGIEIFQTPISALNTRSIIDPDYAFKFTGKKKKTTFGVLFASDNAPGNFSEEERNNPDILPFIEQFLDKNAFVGVLRLKQDFGKQSNIGMILTSYDFAGRNNRLLGIDGRFKLNEQSFLDFQVIGTTTKDDFFNPTTGNTDFRIGKGFGYFLNFDKSGRHWTYRARLQGLTKDYNAKVGFVTRVDTNQHDYFVSYSSDPKPNKNLVSWQIYNSFRPGFDWNGRLQNYTDEVQAFFLFKNQTNFGFGGSLGYERVFEFEFGPKRSKTNVGTFIGDDSERSTNLKSFYVFGGSTPSKQISFNAVAIYTKGAFDFDFGAGPKFPRVSPAALKDPNALLDPGSGNSFVFDGSFNYQPTDDLRFSISFVKSRLVRNDTGLVAFDDNIVSLKSRYQFTRFLFLRTRTDYSSLSQTIRGQYLAGWTPNPGTAFFVGYNDDFSINGFSRFTGLPQSGVILNGRTFFIKLSYLFRKSF